LQDKTFCNNFAQDSGKSDTENVSTDISLDKDIYATLWNSSGLSNPDEDTDHIRTLF